MKKYKSQRGITLIALVITIIILLILAGISIAALTNQGLFKNAKEAQNATQKAEEEQGKTLNEYEDEINKYLENDDKTAEKLVDKVNDGTIKIGDYVKYTPDTASTDAILQELSTYSGSDANTTSTLTQESLNWRVLDMEDGQVRLISELPTTSKIELSSYNGYNNAVKLLDDTCNVLYNNSKLASKVQNLKIEDIMEKMIETNYTNITANYGKQFTPTNKYYPSILLKEKGQNVNGIVGTELNESEQKELINQTTKPQATSLEVKYTYWCKTMTTSDFKNSKYYELFINNGSNYSTYWMSSRCIDYPSGGARFNISRVHSGDVRASSLYNTNGAEYSDVNAFRPVITLNSNVQIISGNGSTDSPFNIQ
ncbi:unknown [Clostridium sp. CAG:389]|nr:unknown [Clostridium sp. CAG:389]